MATSAGLMLGLYPYFTFPGAIAIGLFVIVLMIWDMISLGSIIAACAFPDHLPGDWPAGRLAGVSKPVATADFRLS